jgi:hypothetical protein
LHPEFAKKWRNLVISGKTAKNSVSDKFPKQIFKTLNNRSSEGHVVVTPLKRDIKILVNSVEGSFMDPIYPLYERT